MIVQLLETLVKPVDRQKERFRIADVDGDGHVQGAADFPRWVESFVVHLDQGPAGKLLAHEKAESLQNLQAMRSGLPGASDLIGLKKRVTGPGGAVPA